MPIDETLPLGAASDWTHVGISVTCFECPLPSIPFWKRTVANVPTPVDPGRQCCL